jgi:hypothetical protein
MRRPQAAGGRRAFVGREPELGALMAGLDDASAGRGRFIALVGRAGVRKRLAWCSTDLPHGRSRRWSRHITEEHPALGEHLAARVHTGTFCSYTPDPFLTVQWQF